jgi:hypothetical protein
MNFRMTLILVLVPLLAAPAQAGILFGKKPPKPDPAQRVPELIKTVRTDGDENKRAEAVGELRQYDLATFPEILPTLIDALLNDKKPGVRAEAAQTISKLRPVTQAAGDALEQALDKDGSMRVRLQVRSALLQYHWAGYRQGKKDEPQSPVATKEPPLADPKPANPPTPAPPKPTESPSTLTPRPLPPMPTPVPMPKTPPAGPATAPRLLPQGPTIEIPTPTPTPPVPVKPPRGDSGPDLGGSLL